MIVHLNVLYATIECMILCYFLCAVIDSEGDGRKRLNNIQIYQKGYERHILNNHCESCPILNFITRSDHSRSFLAQPRSIRATKHEAKTTCEYMGIIAINPI
ncbi:hypothetical protein KP509_21G084200 [Ceratopteris richardii]|uniref:Uncharacterized protein n=1 Tax=Ceratopteris richardii TaxID=49495 RepID=A0A8T2SBZ2_CERRI|nr:hypothetical protein KP509_21G084200 [Ceratopteris richardii]